MAGKYLLKGIYIQLLPYLTTNLTDNFEIRKWIQGMNPHSTEELVVNVGIQLGN